MVKNLRGRQLLALDANLCICSMGMGIIMITHDLGVVAETCDDVAVMYCGQIVEQGSSKQIFSSPKHPYTQGLLDSIPKVDFGKYVQQLQRGLNNSDLSVHHAAS